MKNKTNNILIVLLWLLAVTLGMDFWLNTKYGFNLFSLPHWQYLAYMQATAQPVKTSFYISFLLYVILVVFGLYILLQPRRRKIVLPVFDQTLSTEQKTAAQPQYTSDTIQPAQPDSSPMPVEKPRPYAAPTLNRPPRLNISPVVRAPMPNVPLSSTSMTNTTNHDQDYAEIQEIFTSAGYLVKGAPKIKNIQTAVIAIGADEVLWIGAVGIKTSDMKKITDTLNGVFLDTLEDIEIHINAFVVNAVDTSEEDSGIMTFETVDDLRTYIGEHKNETPADDEAENFDAYSAYIGTVIDYIRKI